MNELHDDPHLETFARAGETLGIINGRRAAENAAFSDAYKHAFHAQIEAAGLCQCPAVPPNADDDPVHVVTVDGMSDALRQILTLGKATPPASIEDQLAAYTLTDAGRAAVDLPDEPAGDDEPGRQ